MMTDITVNGRFSHLENAELAATEIRSRLGIEVRINALSENQSKRHYASPGFLPLHFLPGMNMGYLPPFSAVYHSDLVTSEEGTAMYIDRAYMLEAMVPREHESLVSEIISKYGAEQV